jgi:hypothetical protein
VYEAHLPDSFAAMLDLREDSSRTVAAGSGASSSGRSSFSDDDAGPVVFFYCLADAAAGRGDAAFNALIPAQHVVLDTSVAFTVVRVLFNEPADAVGRSSDGAVVKDAAAAAGSCGSGAGAARRCGDAATWNGGSKSSSNGTSQTMLSNLAPGRGSGGRGGGAPFAAPARFSSEDDDMMAMSAM